MKRGIEVTWSYDRRDTPVLTIAKKRGKLTLAEIEDMTESVSHGHAVNDTYTGGGSAVPVDHAHPYKGRKSFRVHLALKEGEKVVMLRCDGGQKYIVLDRWEAP